MRLLRELRDRISLLRKSMLLDGYRRLLPTEFIVDDGYSKSSFLHERYITLLETYAVLLQRVRRTSPHNLAHLQNTRLRKIVRAANRTLWWRDYFRSRGIDPRKIVKVSDLQLIPPLDRKTLMDVPREELLTKHLSPEEIATRRSSGSTTGIPFLWQMDKRLIAVDCAAYYVQLLKDFGFPFRKHAQENFLIRLNYSGGMNNGVLPHFAVNAALRTSEEHWSNDLKNVREVMKDTVGWVLLCNPTELFLLVQKLERTKETLPLRMVLTTGQRLEENVGAYVESQLHCPIVPFYGIQEFSIVGSPCKDEPSLYHIHSERIIIEILDELGDPTEDYGNITMTCLDNFFMPLIRYSSGDIGRIHEPRSCTCNNNSPLLEVEGRTSEVIPLSDGSRISVRSLMKLLMRDPYFEAVRRIQIRHDGIDHITVSIEYRTTPLEKTQCETLRKEIHIFGKKLLAVDVQQVPHFPEQEGSKFKSFVPFSK